MDSNHNGNHSRRGNQNTRHFLPAVAAGTADVEVPNSRFDIMMNETEYIDQDRTLDRRHLIGMKQKAFIWPWNVCTLYENGKLEQLRREELSYKLDILVIQECRWSGYAKMTDQDTFIYSGRTEGEHHTSGVDILMSSKIAKGIIEWVPINHRMLVLKLRTRVRNLSL